MWRNLHHYTSAYPENHSMYSSLNAKIIGKFDGETEEFINLRSKMYSLYVPNNQKIEDRGQGHQKLLHQTSRKTFRVHRRRA